MPQWQVPGYTELRTLGTGGFGEVLLARHDATGTLVAIKYLRHDLLSDPDFAEMFRGEATVLASLDDPNVVRLYEYVEAPAGAAIVMELVGGVSLREIIKFQGKTTAEAALVVLDGSLLGLAAAHRRGVVHRDFKPENVLVNGDGVSKLTDFGIAARTGEQAMPAGTLAYAAPEQMAGGPASPAGDIYAATATFYECLTGRPPFGGDTTEMLLRQHRTAPVPLEPLPEALRPLVAAGMAKDPASRPTDASTFAAELNTAAQRAYGRHWRDHGRSHLGEAALLLAALWPAGAPPTVQGAAMQRLFLRRRTASGRRIGAGRRTGSGRRTGPRRRGPSVRGNGIGAVKTAIALGTVAVVAGAGTALATGLDRKPHPPSVPVALASPIVLSLPSPTPSPSPSPSPAESSSALSAPPPTGGSSSAALSGPPPTGGSSSAALSGPPTGGSSSAALSSPPPSCSPAIATVGPFAAAAAQTVEITGSCFGTGNTTSAADTDYFRVTDLTAGWNACWTNDPGTDSVTCDISSWSDSKIVFSGYTGYYGQNTWTVTEGDQIEIQVWNPQSDRGPATCTVVAGSGSPASCSSG